MKLLAVAGELSGDAHGGPLLRELRQRFPDLEVSGIGGPQMTAEGLAALQPLQSLQVHGLIEVLRHLPRLFRILKQLREYLARERPDALLCIDYPGFNLRLAAAAHELGIPVIWYSSPQIWAWRGKRLKKLARYVRRIVVLFPFETAIYREAGVEAVFVGHPLSGVKAEQAEVADLRRRLQPVPDVPIVGVMPGSRPSELRRNLPAILAGIGLIRKSGFEGRFVLPLAPNLDPTEAERVIAEGGQPVDLIPGAFLPLLGLADLAIVASGTATLQVGMAGIPFIVVYKVAPLTYWLAKSLAYVRHIAMVNILAQREIVPELLRQDLTPGKLRDAFLGLARDPARQERMRRELLETTGQLGQPGAYARGAEAIAEILRAPAEAP